MSWHTPSCRSGLESCPTPKTRVFTILLLTCFTWSMCTHDAALRQSLNRHCRPGAVSSTLLHKPSLTQGFFVPEVIISRPSGMVLPEGSHLTSNPHPKSPPRALLHGYQDPQTMACRAFVFLFDKWLNFNKEAFEHTVSPPLATIRDSSPWTWVVLETS